jgi:hypothetical protein
LRDFLRANPAQAARYGQLKHRLAGLLKTDRAGYVNGKADMIIELLREARRRDLTARQPETRLVRSIRLPRAPARFYAM